MVGRGWLELVGGAAFASGMSAYFEVGLQLGLVALVFLALGRLGGLRFVCAAPRWLWFGRALVILAVLAPLGWRLAGRSSRAPAVEVWSARATWELRTGTVGAIGWKVAGVRPGGGTGLGLWVGREAVLALALALGAGIVIAAGAAGVRQLRMRRFCRAQPLWKRVGRVHLCLSAEVGVPFAARVGGRAYIVLPTDLLDDPARLRLVIAHEGAHHRRGDLRAARALAVLRAVFFWNPLLAPLARALRELEELACDDAVVARRTVRARDYAAALLWAAEHGLSARVAVPRGCGRAMSSGSVATLRRRLVMLDANTTRGSRGPDRLAALLGIAALAAVATGAWAACGALSDRRIGQDEVEAAAKRIEARAGFPILTHERVVAALNRKVGSAEGRAKARLALARMAPLRAPIEASLIAQGLPPELLAVAMAESSFDPNARTSRPPERQSVGLWQIMPFTARNLGLEVSPQRDERLDPARSTSAAAQYLSQLHTRFGDWPVAIAAYNAGPNAITSLITGLDRDQARTKILETNSEFGRYLASVMASAILIEDPALLD